MWPCLRAEVDGSTYSFVGVDSTLSLEGAKTQVLRQHPAPRLTEDSTAVPDSPG